MASVVNAVPNAEFVVRPLESSTNSIVSRRIVKVSCNQPGDYSHNGQNTRPFIQQFDIADSECFLDLKSLALNASFIPYFYRFLTDVASVETSLATNKQYAKGTGPVLDGSIQSLVARLRIATPQGFIIEETYQHGLFSNVMMATAGDPDKLETDCTYKSSYTKTAYNESNPMYQTPLDSNFSAFPLLTDQLSFPVISNSAFKASASAGSTSTFAAPRDIQFKFKNSSILNSMRYFPLFLMRNGLRIEIEYENPLLAFYHQFGGQRPKFLLNVNANTINSVTATSFTIKTDVNTAYSTSSGLLQGKLNYSTVTGAGIPFTYVRSDIAFGDVLFAYKDGILVAWGHVDSVEAETPVSGGTVAIASSALMNMLNMGVTLTDFTGAVDQLYILRGNEASNWKSGGYATSLCPAVTLSSGTYLEAFTGANTLPGIYSGATLNVPVQANNGVYWSYKLQNSELRLDLVKPSSDIFLDYVNKFQMPEGIPYAFTRVLYQSRVLSGTDNSIQQLAIPFSVRSLKALVIVISDPLSYQVGNDATIYNFPSKSSFMTRGLSGAQLTIGGQLFPGYKMNFNSMNTAANQIELDCVMGGVEGRRTKVQGHTQRMYRNYQQCAGFPFSVDCSTLTPGIASTYLQQCWSNYHDTSNFVLGFTTMKKDGDFSSGVDTSQSGAITLNLDFTKPLNAGSTYVQPGTGYSGSSVVARDRVIHIFGFADAVLNLQKDSSTVRY